MTSPNATYTTLDGTDGITEMVSFQPDRVDAVAAPANGTQWLILKAIAEQAEQAEKAGGKLADGTHVRWHYRSAVAEGRIVGVHKDDDDPAKIEYSIKPDKKYHHKGEPATVNHYRSALTVVKEAAAKRDMDPDVGGGVDRDKIPADDFAGKHRSFPIVTPKDVHDAADSIGRAGDDNYSAATLKANIIKIAKRKGPRFVAKLPKSWRKDMSKAAPDGAAHSPAASAAASLPADGTGDSLGAQDTSPHQADLTGQTDENCAPPSGGGSDQQARQDTQAQKKKGKRKRHMDNPDTSHGNPQDTKPGSGPWEGKDVALGEQTVATLEHALQLAREFTEREKAETTDASDTTKEIDMTRDELVKLLDERDEARRAAKKAKKADTVPSETPEPEQAKAADDAAKAAKKIRKLKKRLAAVEAQPARPRPILAGAGVSRDGASAFKTLEDRVAAARNAGEQMDARQQLTTAKMIAFENGRERGDVPRGSTYGPNMVPMLTGTHTIGEDTSISGV